MPSTGFVGRTSELAALGDAVDAIAHGGGSLTLLAGDAGLGKSRLAAEAVALARERGALTAWGRCRETEGAPPFWPWTQVLSVLREAAGPAFDRAIGADAELLAHVLPNLGGEPRSRSDDPFRTYDALARSLGRLALEGPLLVVLDDLHGADPGSLRALRFLAAEIAARPIAVVATYRENEMAENAALTQLVGDVVTQHHVRLIALRGLDVADVSALVTSVTGVAIDSRVAQSVCERTCGNPFFVTEVARLGLDVAAPPQSVREAIRARVSRLPEATRVVLSTASVLGRDFGGALLDVVAGVSAISIAAALAPAAQARLVTADPHRQGQYRFVHALVQEVLYGDLSDAARRATHARATDALDALAEPERSRRIDERAHHARAAIHDDASRARAAGLCEAAGKRAEEALAYDDAALWLGRCLALGPRRRRLDLMLARAEALGRTLDAAEARNTYVEAFEEAARAGDGSAAARAALGVGEITASAGVIDQPLVAMLEDAERRVADDDGALAIRLRARRAIELYWQADREPARDAAADAVARAETAGDRRALGAALHARRFVLRGPDGLAERIAIGERLVAMARDGDDDDLELLAYAWLLPEHLQAGALMSVGRDLAALEALERRTRRPLARWYVLLFRAARATFDGRFDEALGAIDDAQALGARIGSQPAEVYAVAQRAVVLRDIGRGAESIADLRRLAAEYPILVTLRCELAMLLAEAGETAEARLLLDEIGADDFAAVPRDSLWLASIALASEAAATLGVASVARTGAELLRPYAGANVVHGVPIALGAVDHHLGVALAAAGDDVGAVAHLEIAVRLHTEWGAAAFKAASQGALATVLRRCGRAADRSRVSGLESAARADAVRLGIVRPLVAGDARPAGDGLTGRETEILRMIAAGLANKDIASLLRISPYTVERHVANLYAKIGTRNRAEAAAYAIARGLGR